MLDCLKKYIYQLSLISAYAFSPTVPTETVRWISNAKTETHSARNGQHLTISDFFQINLVVEMS